MTQRHLATHPITRRTMLGTPAALLAGIAATGAAAPQISTPSASPGSGWSYTDVLGTTVSLPEPPVRIAANLVTAAALWDLGIHAVAVFDWTASAHPDGDHIAWGNIDPAAVANVGDADGNILPEDLIAVQPDIILTLTFDNTDPGQTAGVPTDLASAIGQIAPVLVITDMGSTDIQLQRLVDLGNSLGADLEDPGIVAAHADYDAKVAEFRTVAADKTDVQTLFVNFDPSEIYVAGPGGVAELQFLQSLGLHFANADSDAAGDFWETLSVEQALLYPADLVYSDIYSTLLTAEELQQHAIFATMPAVSAGQVGLWQRDFPVSYAGVTAFLEDILAVLRDAEKVS